jgi:hypothetical protein
VLEKTRRIIDAPPVAITVLLYEDQIGELEMTNFNLNALTTKAIPRTASVPDVALQMALEAAEKYSSTVFFSHHAQVLGLFMQMDPGFRRRVYFCPWGKARQYLDQIMPRHNPIASEAAAFGAPITDAEAFAVIRAALAGKGATSRARAVYKTSFRDLLARLDPRFLKANPVTGSPNYISALLERAKREGVVHIEPHIVNPMIWLAGQIDLPIASIVAMGKPAEAVTTTATAVPDSMARAANSRPEEIYAEILRKHNMGPFPNVRDDLYEALGKLADQKKPLNRLISACITMAQEAHTDQKDVKIPWRTSVRNFFVNMLSRQAVLRDAGGNYVKPSLPTGQTIIHGVDQRFRQMLDGALVTLLLEEGAQIKFEDIGSLVGALYVNRDSDFHDRLDDVIVYLKDVGAIQYIGGEIKLLVTTSDKVTIMPQRTA